MPDSPAETLTPMVTEYTVNALTTGARVADWWHWNVYARMSRSGGWVVTDGHEFYDAASRSHGTAREAGEHSRDDAIDLATWVASVMRINGETAAEAGARIVAACASLDGTS